MNDLLSQLKQFSVIVADTGDFDSVRKYQPRDTTTNPSLLLKAAQMPEYAQLVEKTLADARKESPSASQTLGVALDKLAVAFGLEILKIDRARFLSAGRRSRCAVGRAHLQLLQEIQLPDRGHGRQFPQRR